MAGEFSFSIALSLAMFGLGYVAAGLRTGRYRVRASILIAAACGAAILAGLRCGAAEASPVGIASVSQLIDTTLLAAAFTGGFVTLNARASRVPVE